MTRKFINFKHVEAYANVMLQEEYDILGKKIVPADHGFKFEFKTHKALGKCWYSKAWQGANKISLGKKFVEHNLDNSYEIEMTMLHEIAHALEGIYFGYMDGHGSKWQKICKSIGGTGECGIDKSAKIEYNWYFECPCCGKKSGFYSKPKKSRSCGKCSPGRWDPKYKMTLHHEKIVIEHKVI